MALDSSTTGPGSARYAEMHSFDPEEVKPFTSDFMHLKRGSGDRDEGPSWQQRFHTHRRELLRGAATTCAICMAAILLVSVTVVAVKRSTMLALPHGPATSFSSWCITPLGGGMVGPGGDFRHYNSSACAAQQREYFAPGGAYAREVELVGGLAMTYFLSRLPANPTQLVVFDIDETVLSNIDSFLATTGSPESLGSEEQLSALHAAGNAPALLPILRLYNTLYRYNYSVAFVTGRSEPARDFTAGNLEAVGYGALCPAPADDGRRRSLLRSDAAAAAAPGAVPPADPLVGRPASPCYVGLMLRTNGDLRYASVYKPEARGALQDLGYEVVGNLGDQFSDLVGINAATPGSFKMPNPAYYIL